MISKLDCDHVFRFWWDWAGGHSLVCNRCGIWIDDDATIAKLASVGFGLLLPEMKKEINERFGKE